MAESGSSDKSIGIFIGYGLRPFFLFAGLYAVLAMLVWIGWLALHALNGVILAPTSHFPAMLWHGHEMLFGYVTAVIAGFLLTAVPNWTGTAILARNRLILLTAIWLAGRLVMWFGAALPDWLVAAIDVSFPLFLAVMVVGPLWHKRAPRNYAFVGVLGVIAAANFMVHGEVMGVFEDSARTGLILGIDAVLLLMTVVGGRIVPAFTSGALRGDGVALRDSGLLDRMAIAAVLAVAIADLAAPDSLTVGIAALIAGLIQAGRMIGWRTSHTLDKPILWVLHLGYGWIAAGLLLKGIAETTGWVSSAAALHGLTVGAIGTLTLGVMSRAALGHTGRALVAPRALAVAYVVVSLAALTRLLGPTILPGWYSEVMIVSGTLWVIAFGAFTAIFWPMLTRPRADGQSG
jgi:uncharacterized protein involved in response to NO